VRTAAEWVVRDEDRRARLSKLSEEELLQPDKNGLVKLSRAAHFLGVDQEVLRTYANAGKIHHERSGERGPWRFRPEDLRALRDQMAAVTR
jgi:hypothetical protein